MEIVLLDPTAERAAPRGRLAPRPATLAGRAVARLDNGKWNAGLLTSAVVRRLAERHGALVGPARTKPRYNHEVAPEIVEDLAAAAAGVVVAIGD